MKFKRNLFITSIVCMLASSAVYANVSTPVWNMEMAAQYTWNLMSGATWYIPQHSTLGSAKEDQAYNYSSTDRTGIMINFCQASGIDNVYGWDYAKMSPVNGAAVMARQGVPFTVRVDPEITWTMRNVELKNYWTSWWFDDNTVIPNSSFDNVSATHIFTTTGTHRIFVLEYYEDQYTSSGILPPGYNNSLPVSCNYFFVDVSPDHAPVAKIAVTGIKDATVTFSGAYSSDPDGDKLSYTWHFDDGGTAHGVTVTHSYTNASEIRYTSHTATLTVSDGFMSDVASTSVSIKAAISGTCGRLSGGTVCK